MKKHFHYLLRNGKHFLSVSIVMLFISMSSFSQVNSYHFSNIDTTERYTTVGFCRIINYLWDQAVIDSEGVIHFVYVQNYKIFLHSSSDDGVTWTKEAIITGKEGKIMTANIGLAPNDKRLIVYTVNEGFTNGTVGSGSEFIYDAYAIVDESEGWEITTLFTHTQNKGLFPFGIITDNDGVVHVILTIYGWWTYGGDLYEATYQGETSEWTNPVLIKSYTDRPVNSFTNYIGKTAQTTNGDLLCMYQRHGAVTGTYNLEVLLKDSLGWQEPTVILEGNSYSTYNRFDIDSDATGNYCIGYFEPWGENGPQINLSNNSYESFQKFELFANTDTLVKMTIHSQEDGSSLLYCGFKHSYPKILKFSNSILEETSYLPAFESEDSINVMRYLYPIQNKSNFSDKKDFYAFTNNYFGREGNDVLPYNLLFIRTNLLQDFTGVEQNDLIQVNSCLYPNPADSYINVNANDIADNEILTIYNYLGEIFIQQRYTLNQNIDIRNLKPGLYFLKLDKKGSVHKFIKK